MTGLAATADARADRAPMVLLPYQQRWIADKSPVKVLRKSRRIGGSWGEAADSALVAAQTNGRDCFYIGYVKDMAQEFINDCVSFARAYALACGDVEQAEEVWYEGAERKSVFTYTVRFASGFRAEALSSAPRNLRGRQGRVILDEAAFHNDPKAVLKAGLAFLIWGGEVHVISSENGVENPFHALCDDILAGKLPYSLHTVTFDDAVADGLYERVCMRTRRTPTAEGRAAWVADIYAQYGADADEELRCIARNGAGKWLARALIEARMYPAPVLRWAPPADDFVLWPDARRTAYMADWLHAHASPLLAALDPDLDSVFGEDFGRTGDLTVIAPAQITRDLVRRFPFLVELRNCPFDQQREALFFLVDALPRFRAGKMDARGNGQYLAEKAVQRYGPSRVEAVMPTQTWYAEAGAPMRAAFEDGTILLPRDADIIDDLRAFEVVRGIAQLPDTRSTGADGGRRHGDSGIAIMMAHAASRAEAPPATDGYLGVPRSGSRRSDDDDDTPAAGGRRML